MRVVHTYPTQLIEILMDAINSGQSPRMFAIDYVGDLCVQGTQIHAIAAMDASSMSLEEADMHASCTYLSDSIDRNFNGCDQ